MHHSLLEMIEQQGSELRLGALSPPVIWGLGAMPQNF